MNNLSTQAQKVVAALKKHNLMIAVAESCTGGMVADYLVSVPGASAIFELGVTAYSSKMKAKILGVKEDTLKEYGAISRQTAAEMAAGVRHIAHADLGISVTGVAGPDPSEGKQPGTVYIALADRKNIRMEKLVLDSKSRDEVRQATCAEVFRMILNYPERESKA